MENTIENAEKWLRNSDLPEKNNLTLEQLATVCIRYASAVQEKQVKELPTDEMIEELANHIYPQYEEPANEIEVKMNQNQQHCRIGFIRGFVYAIDNFMPKITREELVKFIQAYHNFSAKNYRDLKNEMSDEQFISEYLSLPNQPKEK